MADLPTLKDRASGLLLHLTSLPGPHGNGDLGGAADFVAALRDAGQRWWQMLPVGPPGYGGSPYSALSAFAGSPLLVAVEGDPPPLPDEAATAAWRTARLREAHARDGDAPAAFAEEHPWVEDWALFAALKSAHGEAAWTAWDPAVRDREPAALDRARRDLASDLAFHRYVQWRFAEQWAGLRAACAEAGVGLLGDAPIFVAHDSADVWARRDLFELDETGAPLAVAGVPPDYFSATGQRWGNPLFRWDAIAAEGYRWWVDRFSVTLKRFDAVRLDHFIGFQRYWRVPASEPTAANGEWLTGPGAALFEAARAALGDLPLIAEDLGAVTPEVLALRDQLGLPGLRILQFAFGDDPQAHAFRPHNYPRETVVYTGTHDNDTTLGWFHARGDAQRSPERCEAERELAKAYLGTDGAEIHWDLLRAAQASVANLTIAQVQDVLGLGSEARMNRPGTSEGNWRWRMDEGALAPHAERLARMAALYDRGPP